MIDRPTLAFIERRVSAHAFDPAHIAPDAEITRLIDLAARAPTAYNLQNWRFIALRSAEVKARLRGLAWVQPKVEAASVVFIICGALPDAARLPERLEPSVSAGFMPAEIPPIWRAAAEKGYADLQAARDEALRSASFGAANLIFAAEALGLASCPMGGFDAEGVARAFGLQAEEIPVLLVAIGRPLPGGWPQKPRRPLSEILDFA